VRRLLYDDSEATPDELREMLARSAEANGWDERAWTPTIGTMRNGDARDLRLP
jgi:hypothetical protein